MSKEEKAIERCNELIKPEHSNWIGISNQVAIETVLNLIDKQNKVIDEIIDLLQDNLNFSPLNGLNKQELKQYFIRKAEKDGK